MLLVGHIIGVAETLSKLYQHINHNIESKTSNQKPSGGLSPWSI